MGEIRIAAVVATLALGIAAVGVVGAVGGGTATEAGAADASLGTIQTNTTDGTTNSTDTTNTTNETATGIVAGGLRYSDGSAVTNATVTVGSTTATTYETGGYVAEVPIGTRTIVVSLDGETVATRSVNVTENSTTVAEINISAPATIQGWVTDSDGQPISPVLVELREPGRFGDFTRFPTNYVARTQPDADGYYQLSVAPGEYGLGAGSVEYEIAVTNVSLSPGETLTRNFTIDRADGGIVGTVTDESGTPIPNATVTTLNGTASATTGADGAFDLTMAEGTYTVVADADGYQPTTSEVAVQAGQTTETDFSLTARNASQSPLAVAITDTSDPVAPGGTVAVDASLTNRRDETVSQAVSLVVDGATADDTFVSVAAGASESITLVWTASPDADGGYTATVQSGDAAASTVLSVDPSLNTSDGDGADDGTTDDGTDENDTGASDPTFETGNDSTGDLFEGIGNDSTDTDPTFEGIGNDSTDTNLSFEGIGNDTDPTFDGFNTSDSDVPTFEFDTGTGGPEFGFESVSGAPTFEFDTEARGSDSDFETGSGAPTFDFGTETGGPGFSFDTESDAPTFNFSSD